jgi:aspartyl-tRNA synthetase
VCGVSSWSGRKTDQIRRANANLHFAVLCDVSASVQIVCRNPGFAAELAGLPLESVVQVKGVVRARQGKKDAAPVSGVS